MALQGSGIGNVNGCGHKLFGKVILVNGKDRLKYYH